ERQRFFVRHPAIASLADHLDVAMRFEQRAQTVADDRLIVRQQDADAVHAGRVSRHGCSCCAAHVGSCYAAHVGSPSFFRPAGMVMLTTNPSPSLELTARVPPSPWTRSSIFCRPKP